MKLKTLLLTALVGGSFAGSAMAADVYLYISGAPAFRTNGNQTIHDRVVAHGGGLTATSGTGTLTDSVRNGARANQWRIPNYPTAGNNLIVSAAWQGAAAAIQSIASPGTKTQVYIPDVNTGTTAVPLLGATATEAHAADIGFANVFQASTGFVGTKTFPSGPSTFDTTTYALSSALTRSGPLAVSPYRFVGSKGFPGTNVTSAQLEALFKEGVQPLSFFTGNEADQGISVYGTGRDAGSGLRITTQIEVGVGIASSIKHYKPTVTNTTLVSGNSVSGTLGAGVPPLFPAGVTPSTGVYKLAGDGGFVEFGGNNQDTAQLAALTSQTNPPGGYYLIASLENADALTAIGQGAVDLSYNGVPYSADNIRQGKYTFWAYQWIYKKNTLAAPKLNFHNELRDNWNIAVGSSIDKDTLAIDRDGDGTLVYPIF